MKTIAPAGKLPARSHKAHKEPLAMSDDVGPRLRSLRTRQSVEKLRGVRLGKTAGTWKHKAGPVAIAKAEKAAAAAGAKGENR